MSSDYGYDKMSTVELRKVIADLAKDRQQVTSDKKEYNDGANGLLKENKKRTELAVDALVNAEKTEKSRGLEKQADKILSRPLQIQDIVIEKN
jgi:hypothetical protein